MRAAAESPAAAYRLAVEGARAAVDGAAAAGVGRIVLASSAHVYGRPESLPVDEDHRTAPLSDYARAKLAAEAAALERGRETGVSVRILRLFNVYGPGQSEAAVVAGIVGQAVRGETIRVNDPTVCRDFVYVGDVAEALLAAGGPEVPTGVYNIGSGRPTAIGTLVETVSRLTGGDPEPFAAPSTDLIVADVSRAARVLGWSPRTTLEDGLAATLAAARGADDRPAPIVRRGRAAGADLPKVSIVIPVYNGANYLDAAIRSALAQTYPNCEVVVVNDGSDDGGATARVARAYGRRIRLVEKVNGGVASALNAGIAAMRGELFSWLSHDDLYHPEKVARSVELYRRQPRPSVVFTDFSQIDETGRFLGTISFGADGVLERPLDDLFAGRFNGCTFLLPRLLLEELGGFREGLPTTQDYELWSRMVGRVPFVHLSEALVHQRLHPLQGSRTVSHLDEADRLMVSILDATPAETMRRYEGSVEAFLLRKAAALAAGPYAGAAAYARVRARLELRHVPHALIALTPDVGRGPTAFTRRIRQVADRRRIPASLRAAAEDVFAIAGRDLTDAGLLDGLSALLAAAGAAVAVPADAGEGPIHGRLVRRSALPPGFDVGRLAGSGWLGAVGEERVVRYSAAGLALPPREPDACRGRLTLSDFGRLVDRDWYRARYGLAEADDTAIWRHLLAAPDRDPSPWFSSADYRSRSPDVPEDQPAFLHFLAEGTARAPGPRLARLHRPVAAVTAAPALAMPSAAVPARHFTPAPERLPADRPTVLLVMHGDGGGAHTHVATLAAAIRRQVNVLYLFAANGTAVLTDDPSDLGDAGRYHFPVNLYALIHDLHRLGVDAIDIHHALGFEAEMETVVAALGVPFDVTLVDYHWVARDVHLAGPDGRFVGEAALDRRDPAIVREQPLGLYRAANRRIAISRDVAWRTRRLAPDWPVVCTTGRWIRPDADGRDLFVPRLWPGEPLRVLVVGRITPAKGRDLLIEAAMRAAERALPVEFHLVGDVPDGALLPDVATLKIHGGFDGPGLSRMIGAAAPHVAWLPSQVPETHCYTLSDVMLAGLPVIVPALGAFVERCHGRPSTWVLPADAPLDAVLELFVALHAAGLDVPARWAPVDHLPPAAPFYPDDYLAPALAHAAGRLAADGATAASA